MQSAGKDSAAMLLGLHEQGIKNVYCVTYEANFRDTVSDATKKIADSLGFKHTILYPDYENDKFIF
jgi:7-cyano-7-deazaguanine synthase in queuosine biosynthesis